MNSKTVYKIKLKKGDTVIVRAGKYKGRTGKITAVHPTTNMVTVDGLNIVKRHRKPTTRHPQGAIQEITKPLPVGKVGYYDATNKIASKIGFKVAANSTKTRIVKSSGKETK